jgi:hypothetical protein
MGSFGWRGFLVAAASPSFLRRIYGGVMAAAKTIGNALNLTKSKRSRISFKVG